MELLVFFLLFFSHLPRLPKEPLPWLGFPSRKTLSPRLSRLCAAGLGPVMALRRSLGALFRHCRSLISPPSLDLPQTLSTAFDFPVVRVPFSILSPPFQCIRPIQSRRLSSRPTDHFGNGDDDDDEYAVEDEEVRNSGVSKCLIQRGRTEEEKVKEAAEIGYKVIGALDSSERPFKLWEPDFAVVQVGSHQFKVCNGDSIFTERLKFCEVNDKLILNKVLMLGSKAQTIIGRSILPDAAVHAVVDEHALDAKVIIFKKKRRKNYRRTKGHRQELTKLRITDIQGIDKAENTAVAA